jgi:peptidyl-prolyl cis-trans isomerase SurA
MRKLCFSLFITAALLSSHFVFATVDTTDRVVAIVNKGVITLRELDKKVQSVKRNLARQKTPLPSDETLRTQVLDRMITDMVQVQYAQQAGIRVDNAQLDQAISQIAEQNKKSLPQFRESLEKQGYDFNEFRHEFLQDILINRIREQEIESRVFVSEGEVNDWLKNQGARKSNEYELAQILIPVPENAKPNQIDQARQKIDMAKRELTQGASFASVAAKYSSSSEAMQGGVIGWRSGASLPPSFVQMLDNLPIGGITAPIRTPIGVHIFKLLNRRTPHTNAVVTQTHTRHILIRINEFVPEADALQRARQIRERLQNGAQFAELARLYSEDGSASKGGDLGWVNPGAMVPEFEQAMNQLAPGQISEPIRTQFGVHIINVVDRRQQDVGKERERMQVRMELRQRKAEEQYQNWVMQLRDRAYVNIKLNEK